MIFRYGLRCEDCMQMLPRIPDKYFDLILCDLPYGTTCNDWDKVLPMDKLWEQYERVIKDDGIIALFATQPFTTCLINSNLKLYRYSWIWKKDSPSGFLNCNYAPLKITEDICIFSKAKVGSLSKNPIRYYPQGVTEVNMEKHNNPNSTWRKNKGYSATTNKLNSNEPYTQKYTGYPNNILEFPRDKNAVHPTQKPVALCEYLIKTYTKEGDMVLDNCAGSGTTGVACINTHRYFLGSEINFDYFRIAAERMSEAEKRSEHWDGKGIAMIATL